jgi:hypothetical protein
LLRHNRTAVAAFSVITGSGAFAQANDKADIVCYSKAEVGTAIVCRKSGIQPLDLVRRMLLLSETKRARAVSVLALSYCFYVTLATPEVS